MDTHVIYKYRAPGAPPSEDTIIKAETIRMGPDEVLNVPHAISEAIALEADHAGERVEEMRTYMVLERWPIVVQLGESSASQSMLFVILTDPDA